MKRLFIILFLSLPLYCFAQLTNDPSDSLKTEFYGNGKIKEEGRQVQHAPYGLWKFYYPTGRLNCSGKYVVYETSLCISARRQEVMRSTKIGEWIFNYPEGNIKASGNFKPVDFSMGRGKIQISLEVDEWKYYYPTGELMATGYFQSHPKTRKSRRGNSNNETRAKRTGKWEYFDVKGAHTRSTEVKKIVNTIIAEIAKEPYEYK